MIEAIDHNLASAAIISPCGSFCQEWSCRLRSGHSHAAASLLSVDTSRQPGIPREGAPGVCCSRAYGDSDTISLVKLLVRTDGPFMVRTTQAEVRRGIIDLTLGHPSPSLLPLDMIGRAADERFRRGDSLILQYGYEKGDGHFRRTLAEFLSRTYRIAVDPEELFVSNGVSQALDLLCTLFTVPGNLVYVEEPTYFLALRIFADHHLEVRGIPTDEYGLKVEELERSLQNDRRSVEGGPVFLYTIPTHQNPAGTVLLLERRRRIVELSRKYGFLVLADEVYHLLSYTEDPPLPMASFGSEAAVYSLGSFSKILAPGLRLGWIQAVPERLEPLVTCGTLDSGGGLNPFTSSLVRSAIELGLQDQHLARLRKAYGERMAAADAALQSCADVVRYRRPQGGFYYWLELPDSVDIDELSRKAAARGVRFMPGVRFSSQEEQRQRIRLSVSYYDTEELVEGIRRLCECLGSMA